MKEFEVPFVEGLQSGLRKNKNADRNKQGLVTCLNTKPGKRGLRPIVPVTYSVDAETYPTSVVSWPFPQVFEINT